MTTRIRFGAYSAVVAAVFAGACTVQKVSDDKQCTPGDQQACLCDDGSEGVQACNQSGSGFNPCECADGTGGAGGSAGGGSGGASGGGATTDAGPGGADGGEAGSDGDGAVEGGTDDAAAEAGEAPADAGPDVAADGGEVDCVDCVVSACSQELDDCDDDPGCAEGDGGVDEVACIFGCLDDADGGPASAATVDACAVGCGRQGGDASDATKALFLCILGADDAGAGGCRAECALE